MTPSESIAVKFVRRPARVAAFALKFVWAIGVLVAVSLVWFMLLVLFLPLLVLSEVVGWRTKLERANEDPAGLAGLNSAGSNPLPLSETKAAEFIFDRRRDVSKLFGCNTRNVRYRWSLFARRLADLKTEFPESRALDFGAGSLRDSFELTRLGFRVVSVDLNETLLQQYFDSYNWTGVAAPRLFAGPFETLARQLDRRSFHLAISFDVIEHLEDPATYLKELLPLLHERGFFFCIVPNGTTFLEKYFRRSLRKQRQKGLVSTPGVPHLQFRSPDEWLRYIEQAGFEIVDHEMAIGPLVNDLWHAFLGLPIGIYVAPVLQQIAGVVGLSFNSAAFETAFYPSWLMERVHVLDLLFARWLRSRFAWNLIVARRKA